MVVVIQVGVVVRTVLLPSKAQTCRLEVKMKVSSLAFITTRVWRGLFWQSLTEQPICSLPPSVLPSIPHLLCHNEELPLKLLQAALIATPARLQDKPAQLRLRSQLHLLKQSLEHYSGQIWGKEFWNKDCLCRNTLDEPDEFQLMNLNTCIMHNEQRPKGKRDREETSCHH